MPSRNKFSSGASILTLALVASVSSTAFAHKHLTPLPGQHGQHVGPIEAPYLAPAKAKSGTWAKLKNAFPGSSFPDTALVLTDGTVMMHDGCTTDWYKLTPDSKGNYQTGSWKKLGSMQSGYQPLYFASQVLPDGRVIVNGGEYNNCSAVWTTLGSLYDPAKDKWTAVTPPSGWTHIGDAQSVILADGTYMLANCCSTQEALATISGTNVTWTSTGTGKADENDEEGWTILPDETVMTVDANRDLTGSNDCEDYSQSTGAWTSCGKTVGSVVDSGSHELGPAPLLPNGLVFQAGATTTNNIYDPVAGKWLAAPSFGGSGDSADGPAVVLPDGNVLAQVSPGVFNTPSHFFEVKVKSASKVTITQVNDPSTAPNQSSYEGRFVMLPTGQALWSSDVGDVEIYTPQGKPNKKSVPVISKVSSSLTAGSTNNTVNGTGFNGLTSGGYYGDDAQMATNFPLVRITNTKAGTVCYAKTHDHATMGISDGKPTSTKFDIPTGCAKGASTLEVVANGIASMPSSVTIK